jgi:hypothetical protein
MGLIASVAAGSAAFAHHSFAMFDNAKTVELTGTVKELQWTNPHIWVQVMAKDEKGQMVEWSIEGGSPNGLVRQGWRRSAMKPGDAIAIKIHPLKDGTHGGSMLSATINGQPVGGKLPEGARQAGDDGSYK